MTTTLDWMDQQLKRMISEAVAKDRKEIIDWVKEHRSLIEFNEEVLITRDHFDSDSLINYIENKNNDGLY